MALSVVCKQSLIDLNTARKNRQRFENLIYAFSVAVVLLSIVLVAALVWGENPSRAVSGLATIASGGGLAFVLKRRTEAAETLTKAQEDMRSACGTGPPQGPNEAAAEPELPDDALELIAQLSSAP
jgi:hypothetical protein